MTEAKPKSPFGPYCKDLVSKKLMVTRAIPHEPSDVLDRSRHCWCQKTQTIMGPDRMVVDPENCQSDRSCFQSRGAAIL